MIQKLSVLFLIYIILILSSFIPKAIGIFSAVYAQEAVITTQSDAASSSIKINSINFDNSDSIIFLGTSSNNPTLTPVITKKTLTEPNRVYFDIDNSVITFSNSTYELKNSRLKQVKIAQNSISPNVVRIVIWSSDGYDPSQIKVLNIKNNIIIKLGSEIPIQQYLTQVYKETKESSTEYYDKAVVIAEGKNTEASDEIFKSVQEAFSTEGQELVRPNIEQKQARLKSRFFLDKVLSKNGGILLSGIGVVNVESPFTLSEPSRIVFDLPNTIVAQELREKEFKISELATAKIGQFEPSKARIVIRTNNPDSYKPIYTNNLQTLFITGGNNISGLIYPQIKTELASFKEKRINSSTDEINIIFTKPVIYSIKKDSGRLKATFYNLLNFDYETFNSLAIKNKTGFNVHKLGIDTYVLSFPAGYNELVDCYETLNASQLRFVVTKITSKTQDKQQIKTSKQQIPQVSTPYNKQQAEKNTSSEKAEKSKKQIDIGLPPIIEHIGKKNTKTTKRTSRKQKKEEKAILEKLNSKIIVIDPGHGGNDTGAMRGSILEKDLTLQIALKVREQLREKGLTNIIMTRSTDKTLTLDDRVQISNVNDASIFVSIHINASVKTEINGIETHYYTDRGYQLAKLMHKELTDNIDAMDRGLFKSKFYVINHTEAPAVLLELGFISNEHERNELTSEERQKNSAQAIADGIVKFLLEQ